MKRLHEDILALATLAEQLQAERDEYYTESQYGFIRQERDDLLRRKTGLMQRVTAAEKAARQAGLETAYRESAHQTKVQVFEKEIIDLKDQIKGLQQECTVLQSGEIVAENERLQKKLAAERKKNFSEKLGSLESAAVTGVLTLDKRNKAQQEEIHALKLQLSQQGELPPTLPTQSSLAKNLKRFAIGAGFILAGIATVAALGFLGAVAVTYALPFLAIGLVVAAGGTAISKLVQSRHEDSVVLETLESKAADQGIIQRTSLAIKTTLEKAVSSASETLEKTG